MQHAVWGTAVSGGASWPQTAFQIEIGDVAITNCGYLLVCAHCPWCGIVGVVHASLCCIFAFVVLFVCGVVLSLVGLLCNDLHFHRPVFCLLVWMLLFVFSCYVHIYISHGADVGLMCEWCVCNVSQMHVECMSSVTVCV